MTSKPIPFSRNILLHLLPGAIIATVYLLLVNLITTPQIPKALIFFLSGLVMIPVMLLIMKAYSKTGRVMDAVGFREKLPVFKMLLLALGSFLWAALIMTLSKQMNESILNNQFGWMKNAFVISDCLTNPGNYSKTMLIVTWAVGLVTTSTVLPFIEELYFRGFLLRSMGKYGISAVMISALLFSLYHLFSPWLVLSRFIAILPMTFFVWKYKDIRIGIVAHIVLNIVGDTLFAIPIVFGS